MQQDLLLFQVMESMIEYFGHDVRRIQHAQKVHAFAASIGRFEGLVPKDQQILEIAAILHDIGIKVSEEKYQSSSGKYQQIEGPPVAEALLKQFDLDAGVVDRVKFLIAHHHEYDQIDKIDYQILIEADFLVNIEEEKMGRATIETVKNKYFKTSAGIRFMSNLYDV